MNNIKKITGFSLVAGMFLIAALATFSLGNNRTAFAQNTSTAMNQTAAESANKTSTNKTSTNEPDFTTSDIQGIQKTLEDVKKSIAEGKAIDALKQINQIDDKLLDAMSKNPPPMLQKSTGNDKNN